MDDIIIFHCDKVYLNKCLNIIENILINEFKLSINKKKTKIVSSSEGFTFLGYRFVIRNHKTIMSIKNDTLKKIKRRVKNLKYLYEFSLCDFRKVFCSLNTYLYSLKYANNIKIKKIVDSIFFINNY